jgi:hypothetical protein
LVGKSNQLLAALLLHLAEIEVRGAHRSQRCASLYTYCIYELRFSEDAAARRSAAARFAREFPPLLDAVAAGELHLTGLLMIGPHLTRENHVEVLARARFRTKKELSRLVRDLNPLPSAPDVIEPLGPAPALEAPRIKLIDFDHLGERDRKTRMNLVSFRLRHLGGMTHARERDFTGTAARRGQNCARQTMVSSMAGSQRLGSRRAALAYGPRALAAGCDGGQAPH